MRSMRVASARWRLAICVVAIRTGNGSRQRFVMCLSSREMEWRARVKLRVKLISRGVQLLHALTS